MSISDARKEQVNFSEPYLANCPGAGGESPPSCCSPEAAMKDGNKIGVQTGLRKPKWIEEYLIKKQGKKFELVYYLFAPLAVEDVLNGRIVAAAMDDAPAKDAVNKKPGLKIIGGFGMPDETFGYAFRKADTELLNTFNEGLKKIKASPAWEELKNKYELD